MCYPIGDRRQLSAGHTITNQLVALGVWGQVNGRACLASGAPGTCEGDCRLSLDKIGECLVDPSQRGSIVHYQCGHTVKCRQGKQRVGVGWELEKWVRGLKAALNRLRVRKD